MKQKAPRPLSAFNLVEMIVVIAILMVLAALILPSFHQRSYNKATRISCLNNLKEIGTGYRLWAGDNGDLVPSQQTVKSNAGRTFSPTPIKAQSVGLITSSCRTSWANLPRSSFARRTKEKRRRVSATTSQHQHLLLRRRERQRHVSQSIAAVIAI